MRKIILPTFLLTFSLPSFPSDLDTVEILYSSCLKANTMISTQKFHIQPQVNFNSGYCIGVIKTAMSYLSVIATDPNVHFYIPKDMDAYRFKDLFVKWAANNRKHWKIHYIEGISEMVVQKFPR